MEPRERKKLRLTGYDYNQTGCYFLTICTKEKHPILWRRGAQCAPADGDLPLSEAGEAVQTAIFRIAEHYPHVSVEKYVIMPNHIHMILCVNNGRTLCAPTQSSAKGNLVSRVVKHMKESVTKSIGYSIWQKSYHDHIVRNDADYRRVWEYIDTNPLQWREDCYYEEGL